MCQHHFNGSERRREKRDITLHLWNRFDIFCCVACSLSANKWRAMYCVLYVSKYIKRILINHRIYNLHSYCLLNILNITIFNFRGLLLSHHNTNVSKWLARSSNLEPRERERKKRWQVATRMFVICRQIVWRCDGKQIVACAFQPFFSYESCVTNRDKSVGAAFAIRFCIERTNISLNE